MFLRYFYDHGHKNTVLLPFKPPRTSPVPPKSTQGHSYRQISPLCTQRSSYSAGGSPYVEISTTDLWRPTPPFSMLHHGWVAVAASAASVSTPLPQFVCPSLSHCCDVPRCTLILKLGVDSMQSHCVQARDWMGLPPSDVASSLHLNDVCDEEEFFSRRVSVDNTNRIEILF